MIKRTWSPESYILKGESKNDAQVNISPKAHAWENSLEAFAEFYTREMPLRGTREIVKE